MVQEHANDLLSAYLERWVESRKGEGWSFINYSREEDFKRLWLESMADDDSGRESMRRRVLIDWNGYPFPDPAFPQIVEFTTPLDWALAVGYHLGEHNSDGEQVPEVVIVDRCSHRYTGSFAVEMRRALVDALGGHLELYTAFGNDDEDPLTLFHRLAPPAEQSNIAQSIEALGDDPDGAVAGRRKKQMRAPRQGQLRALRQAWVGYTVQHRDHHDINNLIGPLALAGDVKDTACGPDNVEMAEQALFRMADWLDLVESERGDFDEGWALDSRLGGLATADEPVAAVLIDDQAARWVGFLRRAFSGGNLPVYDISHPVKVLPKLSIALQGGTFERCLTPDNSQGERDQVVFLDLRFFSGGDAGERGYLAEVCKTILATSFTCKWEGDPQFSYGPLSLRDQDLLSFDDWKLARPLDGLDGLRFPFVEAAKRILECQEISWETLPKSRLYDHLLTLFPRFFAQVLFTTPIVLFSSTGRRDLTEHFKGYGNIITAFEKPRLPVGYDQVARSLKSALDEAGRVIRARRSLRYLSDMTTPGESEAIVGKHHHVEVFLDEYHPDDDGRDLRNVWVGGFYAVFEGVDRLDALSQAHRFDDALAESGFSYYTRLPYGPTLPPDMSVKRKKEPAVRELKLALATYAPAHCGLVRIRCDARGQDAANQSTGDDAFRRSLSVLIEAFLYEVMAQHFGDAPRDDVSVSIFAGTRVTPKKTDEEKSSARHIAYRWGLSVESNAGGDVRLESLVRSTLSPILDELREFRTDRWPIERAVAIRIIYDYDNRQRGPSYEGKGTLLCRKCLTTHVVRVGQAKISLAEQPSSLDRVRVSKVGVDNRNSRYALLIPLDPNKKSAHEAETGYFTIYCDSRCWNGLSLNKGDICFVTLDWRAGSGYAVSQFHQPPSKVQGPEVIAWETVTRCPNCGAGMDSLRPDYPGGIYIADEVVSDDFVNGDYGTAVGHGPLSFDDDLDENLRRLIEGGRAADSDDKVRAALEAICALEAQACAPPGSLRRLIIGRLAPKFAVMSGREFSAVALRLSMQDEASVVGTNSPSQVKRESAKPSMGSSDELPTRILEERTCCEEQAELRVSRGTPAALPPMWRVLLPGFSRDLSDGQIEAAVRCTVEAQGFAGDVIVMKAGWNASRTARKCEIHCRKALFEWTQATRKRAKELQLPWTDAIPQRDL